MICVDKLAQMYKGLIIDCMYKKQSFWSNIIKQSMWYYLCSALNNGLAILLLPFLSRRLSTEEYGIIQLSTGIGRCFAIGLSWRID